MLKITEKRLGIDGEAFPQTREILVPETHPLGRKLRLDNGSRILVTNNSMGASAFKIPDKDGDPIRKVGFDRKRLAQVYSGITQQETINGNPLKGEVSLIFEYLDSKDLHPEEQTTYYNWINKK